MTEKKFKPLGNRVLIKREEAQKAKGGILLPDNAKEKPKQGEVVAIGPGKMNESGKLEPMELKKGDHVLFSAYEGTEVENGDYLILSEDDVMGVLTK